jgi:2-polyprenyl-6-methoxyphenol hydroxylase-like FAD-dependent oxidoreductase
VELSVRVCIAGGGPAGMMLGLLLARAGVDVLVLEKHGDFLRDFRGDTLHPSTLEVMAELGLLDRLLALPHERVDRLALEVGGRMLRLADMRHLPTRCRFIALMPQWDFLDFLSREAGRSPHFSLRMRTAAVELIREGGRVAGLRAEGPDGPLTVRADLVVAADGRDSRLRDQSRLPVEAFGAPMDVQWFRLDQPQNPPAVPLGTIYPGRLLVLLPRDGYWQAGHVIPKGSDATLRAGSFERWRNELAALKPELAASFYGLHGWDDVKLLTVEVNRLRDWCLPGLLCIGDAAHAMSPIGGVGINLAIQDAVATANLLYEPLLRGAPDLDALRQVQRRRLWPTRMTQRMQLALQRTVIAGALGATTTPRPPLAMRVLDAWPWLRRWPARLFGMGVRPEHVARAIRSG